jgi:hypothetical protein
MASTRLFELEGILGFTFCETSFWTLWLEFWGGTEAGLGGKQNTFFNYISI